MFAATVRFVYYHNISNNKIEQQHNPTFDDAVDISEEYCFMDTHVNKEEQLTPDTNPNPPLVSITSWLDDEDQEARPLSVLRLSTEPVYVSVFSDQGCDVETHYLEATDGWAGGYVHCLGKGCPACVARIDRKRFLLLPVADLTDAQVKLLRVPAEKGPGRLRTEIVKILALPDRAGIVTRITRARDFHHTVEAHRSEALGPDVAAAIKRFVDGLNAGAIDLKSVVTSLTAAEMTEHERVAKRLSLERPGA
jgi:hypothetical protein